MTKPNINRREFLKLTAVGVAVAAGTSAVTSTQASSDTLRANINGQWLLINPNVLDAVIARWLARRTMTSTLKSNGTLSVMSAWWERNTSSFPVPAYIAKKRHA
jgi:hypothetical protein